MTFTANALTSPGALVISGMLLGVLITLIIYHSSLWLNLKSRPLVFYVSSLTFGAITFYLTGLTSPIHPTQDLDFRLISYLLTLLFLIQFATQHLNIRQHFAHWHKVLNILLIWGLMLCLMTLAFTALEIKFQAVPFMIQLYTFCVLVCMNWIAFKSQQHKMDGWQGFGLNQILLTFAWLTFVIDFSSPFLQFILIGWLYALAMLSFAWGIGLQLQTLKKQQEKHQWLLLTQSRLASLGQSFGSITHQAKLPIARIASHMTLIQALNHHSSQDLAPKIRNILPKIKQELSGLKLVIRDFSDFYQFNDRIQPLEITTILHQVGSLLSGKVQLSEAQIKLEVDPLLSQTNVYTDTHALSQIMIIIMENALDLLIERQRYQTELKVTLHTQPDQTLKLRICDGAGGISIQPIERIFESFVSTKQTQSTGIGLSIAQYLTEQRLQGKIFAENTSDGACFQMTFPNLNPQKNTPN